MKPTKANNAAAFKALTALVDYLNKEVKRTSKCNQCQYKGKSFRGEPCYWHVDCGIEDCDKKASDNAMYLLKRFKLQKALSTPAHKGKWKNGTMYEYEYAYCSECGRAQWADWDSHKQAEENIKLFACNYKYCPGCGAEMEGGVYVK